MGVPTAIVLSFQSREKCVYLIVLTSLTLTDFPPENDLITKFNYKVQCMVPLHKHIFLKFLYAKLVALFY